MKPGKECNKVSFIFKGEESDIVGLRGFSHFLDDFPLADLVTNWRNGFKYRLNEFCWYSVDFSYTTIESKRVFSPFLQFKKQNLHPKGKITVSSFVKAILAGQIRKIVCTSKMTDDYYWDHANNYFKGQVQDELDFAEDMFSNPAPYSIWQNSDNENELIIAFSTCSYYHAEIIL